MRISELSRHSGVPTTTIKFYIRDGLLPPGTRSQRNQASYSESHLQRLDLIRALRDVAGLPLDLVREVVGQVDEPWGTSDPVGVALEVIHRLPERDRSAAEQKEFERVREEVAKLVRGLHWTVPTEILPERHLYLDNLTDSVLQLRRYIDPEFSVEHLASYAEVIWHLSEVLYRPFEDFSPRPGDDLVEPTRNAILGLLMIEPLLMSLVRTATATRSARISAGLPLPEARNSPQGATETA